jgi:hypothetical protein
MGLARALHPRQQRQVDGFNLGDRIVAVLQSYFDASYSTPPGVFAIGGYVGTEQAWAALEAKWLKNLSDWNLDEFHLAPLLYGKTSVGRLNAELCALSFAKLIQSSELHGIGAAFREDDWHKAPKAPKDVERFPHPYHFCIELLFSALADHMRLEFTDDQVAVVFDTDVKPDAAIHAIVEMWKRRSNRQFVCVAFSTKAKFPMLQCADLYAGEERKAWIDNEFGQFKELRELYYAAQGVRGHGIYWSLASQKMVEETLVKLRAGRSLSWRDVAGLRE